MVRDRPAQHRVGMLDVAEVPGAVERAKVRVGEFRRVADVMQPRGSFEQVGIVTQDRSQTRERACAPTPWTWAQRRGSGTSSSLRASSAAQSALLMTADATQHVKDVH